MADNLFNKCFCHFNGYEVKDAYARRQIDNNIMPAMETLNDNFNILQEQVNVDVANQITELERRINEDIIGALGGDY